MNKESQLAVAALTLALVSAAVAQYGGAPGTGYQIRTKAQLQQIVPGLGDSYFCSDCSPKKIVVATGTLAGNFADAVGGVFK